MSSNNSSDDDATIVAMMGGFVVAAFCLMFVAVFAALILSVIYIMALDRPYRLWRIDITPQEARPFLGGGIAGAVVLPAFLAFCGVFLGVDLAWKYLPHVVLVGYALGAFGTLLAVHKIAANDAAEEARASQPPTINHTAQRSLPHGETPRFQFASWDDEEER